MQNFTVIIIEEWMHEVGSQTTEYEMWSDWFLTGFLHQNSNRMTAVHLFAGSPSLQSVLSVMRKDWIASLSIPCHPHPHNGMAWHGIAWNTASRSTQNNGLMDHMKMETSSVSGQRRPNVVIKMRKKIYFPQKWNPIIFRICIQCIRVYSSCGQRSSTKFIIILQPPLSLSRSLNELSHWR